MANFEICFICRYPTTDSAPGYGGEPVCAMCWAEGYISTIPSDEEQALVFEAMNHEWTSEELEDFFQETHR